MVYTINVTQEQLEVLESIFKQAALSSFIINTPKPEKKLTKTELGLIELREYRIAREAKKRR